MTNYAVALTEVGKHWTLTASQVDSVTFTDNINYVEVVAVDYELWVTVDNTTPSVAGATSYRVPAGSSWVGEMPHSGSDADVVKVLCASAGSVTVQKVAA